MFEDVKKEKEFNSGHFCFINEFHGNNASFFHLFEFFLQVTTIMA